MAKINLFRRASAALCAGMLGFSVMIFPGNGNVLSDIAVQAMEENAADTYLTEFLNSGYDVSRTTVYDGSNEDNFMLLNGRRYYQGLKMETSYSDYDASVTFNVSDISTISFTAGRIDGTNANDATLEVNKNGVWYQDITIGNSELWKPVTINVADCETVTLTISTNYCTYGLCEVTVDGNAPGMTYTVPEYQNAAAFMNSKYNTDRCTVYDGTNENSFMQINGRKYYQGIKMETSYSDYDAYAKFNTENISKISFSVGRIDNTDANDAVLRIYRDGNWWQDITVGASELWKKINLDVEDISTILIRIESNYCTYGLADFTIDDIAPVMDYTVPGYTDSLEFMNARYNTERCTFYDGSNENSFMQINGRRYYQGVKMETSYSDYDAYIKFNTENVSKISFSVGRIDNTDANDAVLRIYRDGNWWQDIEIGANELWKKINLDVEDISTISLSIQSNYCTYGLADLVINSEAPLMEYDVLAYDDAVDFLNERYNSDRCSVLDGSNEYSYYMMNGKQYYQGIKLETSYSDYDADVNFNVENVDSITFTFGRIDDTDQNDANLMIYKDGTLWYTINQPQASLARAFTIDTTEFSTLSFRIESNYCTYAIANIAINGDYSDFSDGSYAVNQDVYADSSKITDISAIIAEEEEKEAAKATLGDVNEDGTVDSSDASKVLAAYAQKATGGELGLTESQERNADVNMDGAVDSSDASSILGFYAYSATGGEGTMAEYMGL